MRLVTAGVVALIGLAGPPLLLAQSPQLAQSAPTMSVPRVISISGEFRPADGTSAFPYETVTFRVYSEERGGVPLWQETQTIAVDASGRYTMLLGASEREGVPSDLFESGEARWLGITWSRPGEVELARTRITSVPYALRAGDAETLGGLPASAYQLASLPGQSAAGIAGVGMSGGSSYAAAGADGAALAARGSSAASADANIVPKAVNPGTTNLLAKYVTSADVGNSALYENNGYFGFNTNTPMDIITSRFTNSDGTLTGLAVQNLGSSATSYSGMLFYDQFGAVAQFQGFNNSTHEYRINNQSSGGSINFMLNSISRFKVEAGGNVGIGVSDPTQKLEVNGSIWANSGDFRVLGTQSDGIRWVDTTGSLLAHMHRFGSINDRLYVTNAGSNNLTGVYLATDATTWTSTSDERLKTNIEPVTGILDKIRDVRVVAFDMASMSVDQETRKAVVDHGVKKRRLKNGTVIRQQIGSIAQDWIRHFPELVDEPATEDGYYGLDYDRIGVIALGGVKELSNLLAQKDAEIQALQARLAAVEQMLLELKSSRK